MARIALFTFALTWSLSTSADCFLVLDGVKEAVPCKIDLSAQFRWPSPRQTWATCHIHAAVSLIEAACKRKYGLDVDISEAHLYYAHLQEQLAQWKSLTPSEFRTGIRSINKQFTMAGDPRDALNRIVAGAACAESEFMSTREFTRQVEQALQVAAQVSQAPDGGGTTQELFLHPDQNLNRVTGSAYERWAAQAPSLLAKDSFAQRLTRSVEAIAQSDLPTPRLRPQAADGGFSLQTQDFKLTQCLSTAPLKAQTKPFDYREAVQLLLRGVPFICTGEMFYVDAPEPSDSHVVVIKGYDLTQGELRVLVRDSNRTGEVWSNTFPGECSGGIITVE